MRFGALLFIWLLCKQSGQLGAAADTAFQNCETITSVMVPGKSRPTIGDGAFKNCVKMEKTVLCDGVASIGKSIFNNCYSLQNLSLPYCGKSADDTSGRFYQYFGGGTDFRDKMYQIRFDDSVTSATVYYVPNVLTTIVVTGGKEVPSYFVKAMEKLESITLSGQTELVNDYAFNGCTSLKEAYLIGEDSDWDNVEIQNTNDSNKPLVDLVRQRKEGRPLMILADPQDQTVEDGKTALFYVYAAGKYELDYHWQHSWDGGATWTAIDSDGSNKLTVEASPENNGYLYRCVVTDGGHSGRVTSGAGMLTVTEKPKIPGKAMPEGYQPGDANGDGAVDVSDAVLIARFAVGDVSAKIKDIGVINGDVNGDGNTDIQDVTFVLMFIAKRIT